LGSSALGSTFSAVGSFGLIGLTVSDLGLANSFSLFNSDK
jgi:hypothetical protein